MRQKGFALVPLVIVVGLILFGATTLSLLNNNQTNVNTSSVKGKKTQIDEAPNNSKSQKSEIDKKYLDTSIKKLEKIESKTANKEIKKQITEIIGEEEQADESIKTSVASMEARPSYIKIIMGGDYKNAGQVRSEIVHLRNQISKLNRIQDKASPQISPDITEATATLQNELLTIETKLMENLQGFSLLGWLNKLLTGFTLPTPSPSPSGSPTGSIVPTSEPTVTPSGFPLSTPEPTETP